MKSFEYAAPKNLKEATGLLGEKWGEVEVLAGGTDLITSLKQGITAPKRVVSLKNISDLHGIKSGKGAVRIGSMTRLRELIANRDIQKNFPALITAAKNIGSPQMLAMGTVGGDLCQRPRCWYFRNGYGLLGTDGDTSLVREGDNRYHAIYATDGPALFVSASSLGPVLIALDATVTAAGEGGKTREITARDFFRVPKSNSERENALNPNEILTEIAIPMKEVRNATYEVRHRHGLDWPYVTAAVAFASKNGTTSDARVILGHVAATPVIATQAAQALNGTAIDEGVAAKCAEAAVQSAKPLSGNAYKVQLVRTAVKRAVLSAAGAQA
jgi:xanthine dehydrogenase YagS FAD-binding subunit